VVTECLEKSKINPEELEAIAVTNRPGLALCLNVGLRYARYLSRKYNKPLIPVHHMRAHALTCRMENEVEFPFLCLLISGGHSLLTFVRDVNDFIIIGDSLDDAPGECLDKIARRLKLTNLKQFRNKSGGQAIEEAAAMCEKPTDKYYFPFMLKSYRDCQFTFAGIKNKGYRQISQQEQLLKLDVDEVIPDFPDFCANVLGAIGRHLCQRTQRAIEFCHSEYWFENVKQKTLIVSGGVASNTFLFTALEQMCEKLDFKAIRPKRKLCTDNGIMIGWTGVELFRRNLEICPPSKINEIDFFPKCPVGESYIERVKEAHIACNWCKIPLLRPFARA
jgi:N6-L-threonylcarbamoyladenine synthase